MKSRKYIPLLLLVTVLFIQQAMAQAPAGIVIQENIKVSGITADSMLYSLTVSQKQTVKTYIDGQGRAIQSIAMQASPLQNDIIQPVAYDNLGRQVKGYLPYAGASTDTSGNYRANAISTAQPAFYNNTSQYLVPTDTGAYSQQVFENSPLQRMLKAGSVGGGFQPLTGQHYKTVSYRYNLTSDGSILIWNPDGTYTSGNNYATGALSVTDGMDEDGHETRIFTNIAGQVILKRQLNGGAKQDTYYLYNSAGMLSYIIPPRAIANLAGNSYNLNVPVLANQIFKFKYDSRGRLYLKKVPVKGTMYIIYDPVNRPVLLQDSNLMAKHEWNYIRYDVKGRAISQGIYTDNTYTTPAAMQNYVSGLNYSTTWYESRNSTKSTGYYTQSVFPTSATGTVTPLAYAYFDNYDLNNDGTADYSYVTQSLPNEETATTAPVIGMPTMSRKATVGAGITSGTWLLNVVFYDKRGNFIQGQSNNQLYYHADTVSDYNTSVPNFIGVTQVTKSVRQSSATAIFNLRTNFSYDQVNRVTRITQQFGTGGTVLVGDYSYNEIGQVIKKGLGGTAGGPYLQNENMRYNIRGQLLYINNSQLKNDTGKTASDTTAVFGMQMLYNQVDANLGNTAYYNGKLSAVKWMSRDTLGNKSHERSYSYSYDGVDRYASSYYAERTASTGSFGTNQHAYDEFGITYDVSGNVMTMKRNALNSSGSGYTLIDNLGYAYKSNSPCQLLTVKDTTGNAAGFDNVTGSTASYAYDGDGNLVTDPYKGLAITYNVLNRTDSIKVTTATNQYVVYSYGADGTVLRKQQYTAGTLSAITDYIGGFTYTGTTIANEKLSFFASPEGRVLVNGSTRTMEFILTDQQGNARISFKDDGTGKARVTQEDSYYASGLILANSPVPTPVVMNKNLYNGGSELQNDYSNLLNYYQSGYRNYDPAIMRFVAVDPMAESAESMGPYQYAGDNPVMMNDPMGDVRKVPSQMVTSPGSGQSEFQSDIDQFAAQQFDSTFGIPLGGSDNFAGISTLDASDAAYGASGETYGGLYGLNGTNPALASYLSRRYSTNVYRSGGGVGNVVSYDQLFALFAGNDLVFDKNGKLVSARPNGTGGILSAKQMVDGQTDEISLNAGDSGGLVPLLLQNLNLADLSAAKQGGVFSDAWSWTKTQVGSGQYDKPAAGIATMADGELTVLTAVKITEKSVPTLLKGAVTTTGIVGSVVSGGYSALRLATGNGDWKDAVNVGVAAVNIALLANPLGEAYAAGELLWAGGVFAWDVYQAATAK